VKVLDQISQPIKDKQAILCDKVVAEPQLPPVKEEKKK